MKVFRVLSRVLSGKAAQWLPAILLALPVAGVAQPADQEQGKALVSNAPINISADRATYETGTGSYEGNVILTQGELSIRADKLVISEQEQKVNHILALGAPARLTQGDGSVSAEALSIEYFVQTGKVVLLNEAHIAQRGSEISGKRITYDSKRRTVLAEGDNGGTRKRVNMTLQPSTPEDSAGDSEADQTKKDKKE